MKATRLLMMFLCALLFCGEIRRRGKFHALVS